jgi:hypothetical protein
MLRGIKALLIIIILIAVFTVSLPVNYLPYIPVFVSQALADSPETWSLKNGTLAPTKEGLAGALGPAPFRNMVVNISSGTVTSDLPIPVNYNKDTGSFIGTVRLTMQGTYSSSAGMSGQYTWNIDGTISDNKKKEPFKLALTGPFTGPGGLSDGKAVTVSFGQSIGPPIPGCEEMKNTKMDPFDVSYTVTKPIVPGLPNPTSIIKAPACKLPTLKK